jgi:hypothetical protein
MRGIVGRLLMFDQNAVGKRADRISTAREWWRSA